MAYEVNQIYQIVNDVSKMALGNEAIKVVDNQGLIAMGDTVLSSETHKEKWLNTLAMVFTKNIYVNRAYRTAYNDITVDNYTWGNAVRKMRAKLIEAEKDDIYNVEDGQSIDHYQVKKPQVMQQIFTSITPWSYHMSFQDVQLTDAFQNAGQMASFMSMIYNQIQNSIEIGLQGLGQDCVNNFMAEIINKHPERVIKLGTLYKSAKKSAESSTTSNSGTNSITGTVGEQDVNLSIAVNENGTNSIDEDVPSKEQLLNDRDFLKFASSTIAYYSDRMTDLTSLYNSNAEYPTHTPKAYQKLFVNSYFENKFAFNLYSDTWHDEYVKMQGYRKFNFWQSSKPGEEMKIHVKLGSDGTDVEADNIVAVLFDRDALGIFKEFERTATTPLNARGLYYNVYWHFKKQYFNDLYENGLVFTLD